MKNEEGKEEKPQKRVTGFNSTEEYVFNLSLQRRPFSCQFPSSMVEGCPWGMLIPQSFQAAYVCQLSGLPQFRSEAEKQSYAYACLEVGRWQYARCCAPQLCQNQAGGPKKCWNRHKIGQLHKVTKRAHNSPLISHTVLLLLYASLSHLKASANSPQT